MSDIADIKRRMEASLKSFAQELSGLRTGRASANLLDAVMVEAYGSHMPIAQVASVNVPEPRMISVQVWDKGTVKAVEKAIINANLGLNPAVEGQLIRLPIPELSQDRRKELCKIAAKYAENTRIAVRNVRRDGMEFYKKQEKDGVISKDEHHDKSEEVQKLTDDFIKKVDEAVTAKEKEIMTV